MNTGPNHTHWLPSLLRAWGLFAFVIFAIMLAHQSDEARFLGRYSTLIAAVLLGLAIFGAAAIILSRWLYHNPDHVTRINHRLEAWRRWFTPFILAVAGGTLFLMWVYFLGSHLPTYGALRFFIGFSIVITALALGYGGVILYPPARHTRWLRIGILAAVVALALLTVSFYPALWKTDEAFVFSIGWNAMKTGHTFPTIYRHAMPESYAAAGLWTWFMAGWLNVAGFGLTSGRLFVLLMLFIALGFIWAASRLLFDPPTAWFAALAGAFAFMELNYIRYDFQTALLLAVGLFFYAYAQKHGAWWAHFLTGFAVGFAIDGRPIAYAFGVGLALVYLWQYVDIIRHDRRWLWAPFWWLALGGLLALAAFFLSRSGASYYQVDGGDIGSMASSYTSEFLSFSPVSQASQYLNAFLTYQPILFGLTLLGCIAAYHRRTAADRLLLVLFAVWTAIIVFAYYTFPVFYIIHALPVCILLSARGITVGIPLLLGGGQITQANTLSVAVTILVSVWFGAEIAHGIVNLESTSLEDVVEAGRRIAEIVPETDTIVAAEPYYFGMPDHDNFVGGAVESIQITRAGTPPDDVWPLIDPDAIVFSENWSQEPARTPALLDFMADRDFRMVDCWQTRSFGRVELWMAEIPPDVSPPNNDCTAIP